MVRNEYQGLPIQLGRGRLGSTRPSDDVTCGSGTNQTSGPLSSLSPQTKKVELECDNLGYCSKVDSIFVSSILWRFAAISPCCLLWHSLAFTGPSKIVASKIVALDPVSFPKTMSNLFEAFVLFLFSKKTPAIMQKITPS